MTILTRFLPKHFRGTYSDSRGNIGNSNGDKRDNGDKRNNGDNLNKDKREDGESDHNNHNNHCSGDNCSSRLLNLPTELLIQILSNLTFPTLLSYRITCRAFNALISSSSPLQYAIALQTHGLSDNTNPTSACNLSPADRLRLLTEREDAWRTLSPTFTPNVSLNLDHHASWVHHLAEGVLILGDTVTRQRATASNASVIWATMALRCLVLPSDRAHCNITSSWNKIDVGRDILNVAVSIQAHDLIAIVTTKPDMLSNAHSVIQAHLLQFSTRNPHPDATLHPLTVSRSRNDARRPEISVDILGSHLAILVAYGAPIAGLLDEFFLFDWKTGNITMSLQFRHHTHNSFVFLTPQILLFPNVATGCLDVFHIPDPTSVPGIEPQTHHVAYSLALPLLKRGFSFLVIWARAEPKPKPTRAFSASIPSTYHDRDNRPFRPAPAHTVLLFHVGVQSTVGDTTWGVGGRRVYIFLVHRESLLACIPPSSSPAVTLPWKSWGPPRTRWLDACGVTTRLINTSAGQRHVQLASDGRVHVLDFNPWHVRRAQAQANAGAGAGTSVIADEGRGDVSVNGLSSAERGEVTVVDGRRALENGAKLSPWKGMVYSELAYVHTVSKTQFRCRAIMMDDERIIGVKGRVEDTITGIEVLHFG